MTLPDERTRAIVQTREFLRSLCDSEHTPSVSEDVRREARRLLRHYPSNHHIDAAAAAWPEHWVSTTGELNREAPSYSALLSAFRFGREGPDADSKSSAARGDEALDAGG